MSRIFDTCEQALVVANHGPKYLDVKISTAGVVFLGTPHQGSGLADMATFMATIKQNDASLVKSLQTTVPELLNLSRDFAQSYPDLNVMHFYEQAETNYARRYLGGFAQWFGSMVRVARPLPRVLLTVGQAVSQRSAVSDMQGMLYLTTDHSGLNKFSSVEDSNFRRVRDVILEMSRDAQHVVDQRNSLSIQPFVSPQHPDLNRLVKSNGECPLEHCSYG